MKRMILLPLTSLALAACGQVTSASAPTAPPRVASTVVRTAANPTLGTVLTTADGRTLYYFTPERGGTIACTGQCAQVWVPLISPSGLLSTSLRASPPRRRPSACPSWVVRRAPEGGTSSAASYRRLAAR